MSHIAHLRNQIKSINIFAKSYVYIIMLIWRWKKGSSSFWKLNGPYLSNLVPSLVEIGLDNLEKKMKMFTDGQMDDKWSENLNWAFSSGEQKIAMTIKSSVGEIWEFQTVDNSGQNLINKEYNIRITSRFIHPLDSLKKM